MDAFGLDCEERAPAMGALGSLFKLTEVFLWDDCPVETREVRSSREFIDDLNDWTISNSNMETTDDMGLSRQMTALGLPISFKAKEERGNGLLKGKRKGVKHRHSLGHEVDTEEVQQISGEEDSVNLTSLITCIAIEEQESEGFSNVTSEYSLISNAAVYSESSEALDHDETDSKYICDSEDWVSYWDSFYMRYYFYNTKTMESTWDPPLGMEHLAFGEFVDKPNEDNSDIVEMIGSESSIDSSGIPKEDDQSLDLLPGEPCLSFEGAGDNFRSLMTISTLKCSSVNWTEAPKIKQSSSDDGLFYLLPKHVVRQLEDKGNSDSHRPTESIIPEEETQVHGVNVPKKNGGRKKTRLNRKLSIGSGELFQGLLEELSPTPSISRYWCQRYRLFSRFDHGVRMDEEGWFSVTPELIAKHHAIRCGDGVVVDCFTGVGGNSIQFAKRSKHVIAIDIDPKKIEYAQHNAAIYGVHDHIDFIVGDSFILAPRLKADTVFLSPPWGGPDYLKATTYDINTMLKPRGGNDLFNLAKDIASKVVMFLPRTVNLNQLAELSLSLNPPWSLEVERNFLNGKLKAITAYFTERSV